MSGSTISMLSVLYSVLMYLNLANYVLLRGLYVVEITGVKE